MAAQEDGKSLVDIATEFVTNWINNNADEEKLPTELTLTKLSGCTRGTLRVALKQLEAQGRIVCLGGKGGRVINRAGGSQQNLINKTVAVLSPMIPEQSTDLSPIRMKQGIIDALHAYGLHVFFICPDISNSKEMLEQIKNTIGMIAFKYDGLKKENYNNFLKEVKEFGLPVVCYDANYDMQAFDRVYNDHKQGTYDLTVEMFNRGCKNILPIWSCHPIPKWLEKRTEGYIEACKDCGIRPMKPAHTYTTFTEHIKAEKSMPIRVRECSGLFVEYLLNEKLIDGVMLTTDPASFPVSEAIRRFNYDPNKDILIAGFDNYWMECGEMELSLDYPALTVDKDSYKTGKALADLLMKRLHNKLPKEPQTVVIPTRVVKTPPKNIN
ncbi:MAG: substrate-binding domain-containing protein [Kiritimatiellae bacterium]|jgi:DNA-binding LacI/PurR family transcriptional regulator|nr:substrate-binding domain-containing protein [Kiritimatiellia bacterium]